MTYSEREREIAEYQMKKSPWHMPGNKEGAPFPMGKPFDSVKEGLEEVVDGAKFYKAGLAEGRRQMREEIMEIVTTTQFIRVVPLNDPDDATTEIRQRSPDEIEAAIRALPDTPPEEE